MLTVDYDRLELEPGHLLLDMGAGAGRHAFEAYRRGARVVALDYGFDELPEVKDLLTALHDADEGSDLGPEGEPPGEPGARAGRRRGTRRQEREGRDGTSEAPAEEKSVGRRERDQVGTAVNGDGTRLPFPDATFDRIICSEVLEHIPDEDAALAELRRVLKPDGMLAATVPSALPERVCWKLSAEYHAPFVVGGHVRIFTEEGLRQRLRAAGFRPGDSHRAHALHSPYWWLKCAVGPTNDDHPLVRTYHRLLVWDISRAPRTTRWTEQVLNPVMGKSLVVYARPRPVAADRTTSRPDALVTSVDARPRTEVPA